MQSEAKIFWSINKVFYSYRDRGPLSSIDCKNVWMTPFRLAFGKICEVKCWLFDVNISNELIYQLYVKMPSNWCRKAHLLCLEYSIIIIFINSSPFQRIAQRNIYFQLNTCLRISFRMSVMNDPWFFWERGTSTLWKNSSTQALLEGYIE